MFWQISNGTKRNVICQFTLRLKHGGNRSYYFVWSARKPLKITSNETPISAKTAIHKVA